MKSEFSNVGYVIAFCVLIALALCRPAAALVNPELHTAAAPEALTIQIVEQRTELEGRIESVWLRAKVVTVLRSQSDLEPGDEIEIRYLRDLDALKRLEKWLEEKSKEPDWAGDTPPSPPGKPEVGETVRAFLSAQGVGDRPLYRPDAREYSFEPM